MCSSAACVAADPDRSAIRPCWVGPGGGVLPKRSFFSFYARQRFDGSIHVQEGFVAVQRLCGGCSPCFFPSNCCAAPNASVAEQCARAALRFGKRVSIVMFFT